MKNIMIVDDSSVVRKMIRITLESSEFHIIEAADGIEALEALARGVPDLFIIDLNMPRLDGLSLVRRIRTETQVADTPIIMLTTECQESDRRRGLEAGVTMYIEKPVSPTLLKYKVQSMLSAEGSAT